MNPTVAQSLPIISLVVVGFLLKQTGLIRPGDGSVLTRFILNVTLPAVIFLSVSQADVAPWMLGLLALCGLIVSLSLRVVSGLIVKWLKLDPKVAGVIVVSTMVMNVGGFLFPIIQTIYGHEGISRLAAFDLGNSLIASGYGYYLATCFGDRSPCGVRSSIKKAFSVPILWASIVGIVVNLSGLFLPGFMIDILKPVGAANTPLAMIALGVFLQLRFPKWKLMALTVSLRMGFGFLIGQALIYLMNFQGLERMVVGMGSATPIGMVPLVYAVSEGLDTEFAASVISLSIIVGLVLTPILLTVF